MTEQAVRLCDLQRAFDRMVSALSAEHGEVVPLPQDYYWHLPVDNAFDMSREPATHTAGQVSDDLADLSDFASAGDESIAVWHELQHLIGVLRALEQVSKP